jgi:hypothetical protein
MYVKTQMVTAVKMANGVCLCRSCLSKYTSLFRFGIWLRFDYTLLLFVDYFGNEAEEESLETHEEED